VIGAYEDCNIRIFDDKKIVECFKAHKEPVMGISLNWSNANSLFSCSQDGSVKLWDMRRLKEHVWESIGHQRKNDGAAHFIQTNFDGTCISGGADSLLKIYAPVI
jgi:WD40 repeat protein